MRARFERTAASRILASMRAGRTFMSWEVHHTSLRRLVGLGLVACGDDCVVRLTAAGRS